MGIFRWRSRTRKRQHIRLIRPGDMLLPQAIRRTPDDRMFPVPNLGTLVLRQDKTYPDTRCVLLCRMQAQQDEGRALGVSARVAVAQAGQAG